jgi:nucleoside-diphosphate-sugar epimerase
MPGDSTSIPVSVEVVTGSLSDQDALAQVAEGVEAVFHLAGALTSRGHTEDDFVESNVRGTFNLLSAVRDRAPGIQRFIFASSDAVYYQGADHIAHYLPVDEEHPRLAGSVYGATKIGAEEMCLSFHRGFSLPTTILRFGATVNAKELVDPTSVFARWLFLRAAIDALGSGAEGDAQKSLEILKAHDADEDRLLVLADLEGNPEVRQWADARDIARGCLLALNSHEAVGETFNLGGAAAFSMADLVLFLSECLKLPVVKACLPTARPPWHLSSAKAERILGYTPAYTVYDMAEEASLEGAVQRNGAS